MNAHRRPGGLTALAVINFIFAAMSAFGVLALSALLFVMNNPEALQNAAAAQAASPARQAQQAQLEALLEMGKGMFVFMLIFSAVSALLLIVSGIGYLKLRKFLGRVLGNVTALLSIAVSVASAMFMAPELGGGFNLMTVAGLVYPALTLFFLNVTFKEDFVNP